MTQAGERMDAEFEADWSFSDRACFFAAFLMSLAYRWRDFRLHLHEDFQSDGRARHWMKGFAEYLAIFSCR